MQNFTVISDKVETLPAKKLSYEAPRLEVLGDVKVLTQDYTVSFIVN